jgi:hypothetical protein
MKNKTRIKNFLFYLFLFYLFLFLVEQKLHHIDPRP